MLYAIREELPNEVDSMLEMGVVKLSKAPYASPIVIKKDDSNRVCVDFRKLSKPITMVEDLFRCLSGKKYLSKINLTKGYWHIPVAPKDEYKTASMTPDGQYEFLEATLVRGLKKVLKALSRVGRYIDDDSWEEHLRTLKELFGRLRRARNTDRLTKYLLGANRMEFIKSKDAGDVITPSVDILEIVRKTLRPTTKKQVRSSLGLVGYYRDHIPAFAEVSEPLSGLFKKAQSNVSQEHAYSLLK